ncbi:Uncharacterised protein [Legionella spiritensis]|nr:Uncharacterised protein [Legionella spiritensis]
MRGNVHLGARLFPLLQYWNYETRNTAAGLLTGYCSFLQNDAGTFLVAEPIYRIEI